jgi:hypothetical protein
MPECPAGDAGAQPCRGDCGPYILMTHRARDRITLGLSLERGRMASRVRGAAMVRPNHRKRALSFLAAVLLPSGVLVGTSVRLIRQERELAVRRAAEERVALALRIGQMLVTNLRSLEVRIASVPLEPGEMLALADSEPAVLTLAATVRGRLVFAWDMASDPAEVVDPGTRARYARILERGEAAEYRTGNLIEAAELYERAAASLGRKTQPEPRLLARGKVIQRIIWHPKGLFIAFLNWDPEDSTTRSISVVSLETGEVHQVLQVTAEPGNVRLNDWSPDGRWIGFSELQGTAEYWMVDDPLGEQRRDP